MTFPPAGKTVRDLCSGANHTLALVNSIDNTGEEQLELWVAGNGQKGQLGQRIPQDLISEHDGYFRKIDVEENLCLSELFPGSDKGWGLRLIACGWEVSYIVLRHTSPQFSDVLLALGTENNFGCLGVDPSGSGASPSLLRAVHLIDLSRVATSTSPLRIVKIVAGPRHAVCVVSITAPDEQSMILGWGAARHGQLGEVPNIIASNVRSGMQSSVAYRPQVLRKTVDLTVQAVVGRDHTVILECNTQVTSMGGNRHRQCSILPRLNRHWVRSVCCRWTGTHLLTVPSNVEGDPDSSWKVWSCGSHDRGQWGIEKKGAATDWGVLNLSSILHDELIPAELHCGSEHVLLRLSHNTVEEVSNFSNGEVWGWGWNEHGNLSTGNQVDQHKPIRIWPTSDEASRSAVVTSIWAGCGTSFLQVRRDAPLYTAEQLDSCRRLPKVELHAHLSGSIRRSTLRELALGAGLDDKAAHIVSGDARSLPEMFAVFEVIHKAVRGVAAIRRIAREVLEDFEADGVLYAEVRTTPRAQLPEGLDREGYVSAVLAGFADYTQEARSRHGRTEARLLLSIDRRDPVSIAQQTVNLAVKFKEQGVVGIDLSGDPSSGDWSMWESALTNARKHGLKVALHAGEMANRDDEMTQMLIFAPERFGHVCYISTPNLERLRASQIPVELCLTSNVLSNSVNSYDAHHFRTHYSPSQVPSLYKRSENRYRKSYNPVILCTDDSAVFGSSLTQEYAIAMQTFNLEPQAVRELALEATAATFLVDEEKAALRRRMTER